MHVAPPASITERATVRPGARAVMELRRVLSSFQKMHVTHARLFNRPSRGSKGKKYRKTGNQMDVERRQSDHGDDQGGASGGGGLSQSGGS